MDEGASTIFVAQTGWGQAEHKAKSRNAGFDYHLVKPLEASTLEDLLEECFPAAGQ